MPKCDVLYSYASRHPTHCPLYATHRVKFYPIVDIMFLCPTHYEMMLQRHLARMPDFITREAIVYDQEDELGMLGGYRPIGL